MSNHANALLGPSPLPPASLEAAALGGAHCLLLRLRLGMESQVEGDITVWKHTWERGPGVGQPCKACQCFLAV